jgi:prepilin-type N-terminal cleavage/methylation domain-containing protein
MSRLMIFEKKGFSLIEVLICLVFLSIGLLAIASLQVTSVRGNFFSNNLMQATYVAQDRLEFLQNLSYDSSRLVQGTYNPDPDGPVTVSGVVFERSYAVSDHVDGYKLIHYTVRWIGDVDRDGKPIYRKISFSTIRAQ